MILLVYENTKVQIEECISLKKDDNSNNHIKKDYLNINALH